MFNRIYKHFICLLFFFSILTVDAQNKKNPNTLPALSEREDIQKVSLNQRFADRNQTQHLAAWLKEPYLQVPVEKATVTELTIAFNQWLKAHPEETKLGRRDKDDDVAKYQRKLYRMQLDNAPNELPVNAHEKLDAFVAQENQTQHESASGDRNPDGNWKLLGPVTNPIEIPYSEPAFSPEKSADNAGLGRINCIEFSNWDTRNMWVGTSTGGVWKTFDSGQNWINISMNLPIMEITDIAIDQSNSNIIYVATGDRDGQGGWYGNGVGSRLYKTTDGGSNWTRIVANFGTGTFIENLWVHPKRPSEVVVVKSNGVYKSMNSGATWTRTYKTDFAEPFDRGNDLYFQGAAYADLANPERVYAAYYRRYDGENFSFQLHRSDNFGSTWQVMDSVKAMVNEPDFATNNTRLRVAPSDANCLYIAVSEIDFDFETDRFGGIIRTLDGGQTWETRSRFPDVPNTLGWVLGDSSDIGSQGLYNLVLSIDPKNKDKIFVDGVDSWGSTDGGRSFNKTTFWLTSLGESAHADHHWGEFQPISGSYFLATDGGLYKTNNLTPGDNKLISDCRSDTAYNFFSQNCYQLPTKWDYVGNGISNNEFYAIAVSKSDPSIIMAGAQDNGTMIRRNGKWYSVFGGDGFVSMIHPTNPNIFYVTVYNGLTWRTMDGGQTYRMISLAMDEVDRGSWLTPMEMSETNPNIIIQGRDKNLWRSTNAGNTWTAISDFKTGKLNQTFAVAMAPSNNNVIYVGRRIADNPAAPIEYFLHKTTDGGATWTDVWSPSFPEGLMTDIAVHPTQPNRLWVTFSVGYSAGNPDQAKKVFYSANGGTTWTNITAGLPATPAFSIAFQENSPVDAIYVGTGVGMFYKDNTMPQFVEFQVGMPRGVMITDVKIHATAGKVFAGTYGRGIWSANLRDQAYEGAAASARVNRNLLLGVYPNPTKGVFKIEWNETTEENQSLQIVDVMGKEVYTIPQFQNNMTVDLSNQVEGVYFLRLKSGNEVLTKKLIVQH